MEQIKPGAALLMEGGALRGMFTAGVLDVWMERGLRFDAAVGVSAGAAFGCNLKSRQIGRAIRYNLRFCKEPSYCSLRSLLRTGDLFGAEFCYDRIPKQLDPFDEAAYDADPMAFYVVCTDVDTGKAVYRRCDRIEDDTFDWFRASASMPFFSKPVALEGRRYLDGGIADPIPVGFLRRLCFAKNVAILTQPRGYMKKRSRTTAAGKLMLRKYPALYPIMERRAADYMKSKLEAFRMERDGDLFVVCPEQALPVSRLSHDPNKLTDTYLAGRNAALKTLPALLRYLGREPEKGEDHADAGTLCGP